jgi:hypothetical protein
MDENESIIEELELTSEQKKVLGRVYRYILSWDSQPSKHSDAPSIEIQDREQPKLSTSIEPISNISIPHKAI